MNSVSISHCPSSGNRPYVNRNPVASHTRPTSAVHMPSTLSASPCAETRAEQEITPVRACSRSSAVNCLTDIDRSGSAGPLDRSGPSSSCFRFLILHLSHSSAMQEAHLDSGSPCTPRLQSFLHIENSSLGLLLLQL